MSQTKYKMPHYVRQAVVWLCRGYEDNCKWVRSEMDKIYSRNYTISDMPRSGEYRNRQEDIIDNIDERTRTKFVQAIDQAKLQIGLDLQSEELKKKLTAAIWTSTLNGREYPYEVWDLPTIYRDDFYERKRKFIYDIAVYLDLI